MNYNDSVRKIKGVGEKAENHLHKLDIFQVGDLLEHYPRDYDEFKELVPISELQEGKVMAVEGVLRRKPTVKNTSNLKIITAFLEDETGVIQITWFNMPFLKNQLRLGTRYIMRGKIGRHNGKLVLEQPKLYSKNEFYKKVGKMLPIYPLTAGLTNHQMTKVIQTALSECEGILEFLPQEIRKRNDLVGYKKAVQDIHFPKNRVDFIKARKRLVFDELFLYQAALRAIRFQNDQKSCHVMIQKKEVEEFVENLPFALTGAQRRVYDEILTDLSGGCVMNRLVQGDVGSGKTVVAVLALYLTVCNGSQGAFMVPTEVLALQHYASLQHMLGVLGVRVGLLTGSLTAKQKREGKEKLASGEWNIVVGTHAILQDNVEFQDLALVITDEQHRFGVRQREVLSEKGEAPHILAMSATPIPRTLALVLYGDMDLSVMDELPANRLPIKNCVVGTDYRPNAYRFMKEQIEKGHQVYIICPMVEENEDVELESVALYTEQLRQIFHGTAVVDSLHGKMKPAQKNEVMERFGAGQTDILVSTTVIEVGIDVPNATVMMIENAERFGLAGLHQLRGRVGRGEAQSYCILMYGNDTKEGKERLSILASSNDGFHIAREDLRLRGQGDFFGVLQSGDKLFKLADIYEDAKLLQAANEEAKRYDFLEISRFYARNRRLSEKLEHYMGKVSL
ncbi:MAG: ATP-dependent DNA helicase RecG [Eubacterium sp.]|nr:ATP-dependent DNA helicase RecG [Eubacterium sp.]